MAARSTIAHRTSLAETALQNAWRRLRRIIPGLPRGVVINILDVEGRRRKRGHFAAESWEKRGDGKAHEVAISPYLFSTSEDLLATLVHEAVHAVLFEEDPHRKRSNGGCSLSDPR